MLTMNNRIGILLWTAASIGFLHTLMGPDHYLPFIVMARARKWSVARTLWITAACGLGHVASSVVLGIVGIALGIGVNSLVDIESVRGNLAAWALTAFGLVYLIWGVRHAIRRKPHTHFHVHDHGTGHQHEHSHVEEHAHIHEGTEKKNITPWVLFVIFILGPCEPLIPILMYPAAQNSIEGLVQVSVVFSVTTVATMLLIVLSSVWGLSMIPFGKMERYTHATAGAMILLSGLAIQFLGL